MIQYNISFSQPERPVGAVRASPQLFVGAMAGAFALHGLAVAVLLALAASHSGAIQDTAVTVFLEPGMPAVATAVETFAPAAHEPDAVAAPPEPDLRQSIPPPEPMESLAPPEFSQPPPPSPRAEPPKPAPAPPPKKVEPKHVPAAPAARAVPPSPAPTLSPGTAAPSGSPSGPPAAAPAVAPGWNALLAAWLAAHRRYSEDARKRGEEGDVTIRFTVTADGRVSDVAMVKASGFQALDASALAMLQGATLPAPGIEATRTVRIRFRLRD